jgi:hypothetical protein
VRGGPTRSSPANDDQYRLARDAQHLIGLRAAIATIEKRLAAPTDDTLSREQRRTRRKAKLAKGYATQAERFAKQRRLQVLRAELGRVIADRDNHRVRVVEGGKRLAKTRHNLDAAELTVSGWREEWDCARDRIEAKGSGDEPFGNLTITVTPGGEVSLRLPKPLEHLANAPHGRYILSGTAVFAYRADEWRARITGGQSVAYAITRTPGRGGRYVTAAWACPPTTSDIMCAQSLNGEALADGPVVGVDLNDGHLALRRLDEHGNPTGSMITGSSPAPTSRAWSVLLPVLPSTSESALATGSEHPSSTPRLCNAACGSAAWTTDCKGMVRRHRLRYHREKRMYLFGGDIGQTGVP